MESFSKPTRTWFERSFGQATRVQDLGWPEIAGGRHALLLAPTGSGKTLAAFLSGIDRVVREGDENAVDDGSHDAAPHSRATSRSRAAQPPRTQTPGPHPETVGVRILYVSPLKALAYDIERNLRAPIAGIAQVAAELGIDVRTPRVDVRTGDTPQRDRARQRRDPAEILVTTPESLYLILGSQARETLRSVHTVIVDEVHAIAPSKRGTHLALSLERLCEICEREPQRIGLSATARPVAEIALFLGGDREVVVVDASSPPRIDLTVSVPVPDMERVRHPDNASGSEKKYGLWPAIYPQLLELIRGHRSTILFVNNRSLCERLAQKLNELAGEDLTLAHHGSVAHDKRREIEAALGMGDCRAIVATSSLELGIDMEAVELVVLVESPGSAARGLQRIGRAGHQVGVASKGVLVPKFRGDLLESTVLSQRMQLGEIEELSVPHNALDVLAQQIAAMVCDRPRTVDEVEALVRRSAPYRELGRASLVSVLDMLSGRFPSDDFAELRPRIAWDRSNDVLTPRRGTEMLVRLNAGTIPDRGLFAVHLGHDGPRIGELDEEMTYETKNGDVILLGASSWRVLEIGRDRVVVEPAPGEPGRLPFWRGDGPGRPIELGRAIGAFCRELADKPRDEAIEWLRARTVLDEYAAQNLVEYIAQQRGETGSVPSDERIGVETFRDELGDWRVCILTPFGSRVHAPWALALQSLLAARTGCETPTMWSDDGIVLTFADGDALPPLELLFPDPEELENLVVEQLARSALFAATFRENAGRSLLLPKRRPDARSPLWAQRLKAKNLMSSVQRYPDFPIVLETYRQCLRDVFDLPALDELLRAVRSRKIAVDDCATPKASPFARSLVFAYVAAYLYEQDAPAFERRAQALTLDRGLLRELLGQGQLRELVDAEVLARIEDELQCLNEERRARDADELHDVLRRLGALELSEIAARTHASDHDELTSWLTELETQQRAVRISIDSREHWIAAQDAGLYRDALGVKLSSGLPSDFVAEVRDALNVLLRRHARTHGPFTRDDAAAKLGRSSQELETRLAELERRGTLVRGELRPQGKGIDWCDEEVFRRIKRETLAKLRGQIAAVDGSAFARFLPAWHGVQPAGVRGAEGNQEGRLPRHDERSSMRGRGRGRLLEAIAQLEGFALPWSTWWQDVLPARVEGFALDDLDQLSASGQVVWVGAGALGVRDGRVAIFRSEHAALLLDPPTLPEDGVLDDLHETILACLSERGAMFTHALEHAVRGPRETSTERDARGAPHKGGSRSVTAADFEAALFDLVWLGLVTNDSFAPLRSLTRSNTRRRGRAQQILAGGRWSLVADLTDREVSATERAHARAKLMLERWGVVSREAAHAEGLDGGFAAVYPVLKAMEEGGLVRRGHFVEGLAGAQFALAGAVDRLREANAADNERAEIVVLAANDPANPWGVGFDWPESTAPDAKPRRVAGARVVLADGRPVLWLSPNGRQLVSFVATREPALRRSALTCVSEIPRRPRFIEKIDGSPAAKSELLPLMREVGFVEDYRGLSYDENARRA